MLASAALDTARMLAERRRVVFPAPLTDDKVLAISTFYSGKVALLVLGVDYVTLEQDITMHVDGLVLVQTL